MAEDEASLELPQEIKPTNPIHTERIAYIRDWYAALGIGLKQFSTEPIIGM